MYVHLDACLPACLSVRLSVCMSVCIYEKGSLLHLSLASLMVLNSEIHMLCLQNLEIKVMNHRALLLAFKNLIYFMYMVFCLCYACAPWLCLWRPEKGVRFP